MDFDGVFTDDYVSQDQNGKESIVFSRKGWVCNSNVKREKDLNY